MSSKLAAGAALLSLAGCMPSLVGEWEGEIECEETSMDLSIELEADGGGEFSGDLETYTLMQGSTDGTSWEAELSLTIGMVFEIDGGGEQDLDYEAEIDDADCRFTIEGELYSSDCEELGFDVDIGQEPDLGDFTWDGADTIEIDDGDCRGELER